jgi:hypothetical protein
VLVDKLQGEVADDPEKAGQVATDVLLLLASLQLDVLRDVCHQREAGESILVDAAH